MQQSVIPPLYYFFYTRILDKLHVQIFTKHCFLFFFYEISTYFVTLIKYTGVPSKFNIHAYKTCMKANYCKINLGSRFKTHKQNRFHFLVVMYFAYEVLLSFNFTNCFFSMSYNPLMHIIFYLKGQRLGCLHEELQGSIQKQLPSKTETQKEGI